MSDCLYPFSLILREGAANVFKDTMKVLFRRHTFMSCSDQTRLFTLGEAHLNCSISVILGAIQRKFCSFNEQIPT